MARCETIQPLKEWTEGDNVVDVFHNLLKSLLWAKDNLKVGDYVYGNFKIEGLPHGERGIVVFGLTAFKSHDCTMFQLKTESSFSTRSARDNVDGDLQVSPDGSFGGVGRYRQGAVTMTQYGLRQKGDQMAWCVTGQNVWHNVNDIEADQMPTNKGQLSIAIRHYYIKRAIDVIGEIDVPDDFAKKIEKLVYGKHSSSKGQYIPLDDADKAVFREMVKHHELLESMINDSNVRATWTNESFFEASYRSARAHYQAVRGYDVPEMKGA